VEDEVLLDRREGNNRLVHANTAHPLVEPMRWIVAATSGPVPVLRELIDGVPGVQEAYVYGSWARRSGEPDRARSPGVDRAWFLLAEARRHLVSARTLAATADTSLAFLAHTTPRARR
jgi:hypothetical protein